MLLKNLRKEDLEHIYNFCKKSNFKLDFGKDYIQIKTDNSIYFVGIIKIDNNYYYSINQLSKYNNLSLKSLLSRIKFIDKQKNK